MATENVIEQLLEQFEAQPGGDEPVLMLNLLRYRERADYGSRPDEPARSGREAYGRYAQLVMPLISRIGAKVQLMGRWQATLLGAQGEQWDDLLMVQYPDRQAFVHMIRSADYQAIAHHRQAAIVDSKLIAFTPGIAAFQGP